MKVFISWSGLKSQRIAEILKKWIPCVIQSIEPYFSSADIDKGARWSTDIARELDGASFGILCVTKQNIGSEWLNFEAGALSKSIDNSRVCPLLIDLKPSDIQNSPILQFQMTSMNKEEIYKLFLSMNAHLGDGKLKESVLQTTFDTFWPGINSEIEEYRNEDSLEKNNKKVDNETAILDEILELVRYQHKLLKTPSEFLPADYVIEVFNALDKNPQMTMRQMIRIRDLARKICTVADVLSEAIRSKEDKEYDWEDYMSQVATIQHACRRLMLTINSMQHKCYDDDERR